MKISILIVVMAITFLPSLSRAQQFDPNPYSPSHLTSVDPANPFSLVSPVSPNNPMYKLSLERIFNNYNQKSSSHVLVDTVSWNSKPVCKLFKLLEPEYHGSKMWICWENKIIKFVSLRDWGQKGKYKNLVNINQESEFITQIKISPKEIIYLRKVNGADYLEYGYGKRLFNQYLVKMNKQEYLKEQN